MDYLEDDAPGYGGRPGLATAIAAFLMIASCTAQLGRAGGIEQSGGAAALGFIVGGAILGAIVWGICYAITIKRASPPWQIATLITLMVLGVLSSLVQVTSRFGQRRSDGHAAARALIGFVKTGAPITAGEGAGPLTRLMADGVNRQLAVAKAYSAQAEAAGLNTVVSFQGLTKQSPVLDHCDRITALAEQASTNAASIPRMLSELRRDGDALVTKGQLSQDELDAFMGGATRSSAGGVTQWRLSGEVATDGSALCHILARRRWQMSPDGQVLFSSDPDLAAAQPILARLATTMAEFNRNRDAAKAKVEAATTRMQR